MIGDLFSQELVDDLGCDIFLRDRFPDDKAAAVAPIRATIGFLPIDDITGADRAGSERGGTPFALRYLGNLVSDFSLLVDNEVGEVRVFIDDDTMGREGAAMDDDLAGKEGSDRELPNDAGQDETTATFPLRAPVS